jgi:acetyl-CoA carboxylase biotin carboxyl carrier protein
MSEEILVPMAGKILEISVKVGDAVTEDDVLLTLDAMKMENPILCPVDGMVKEIRVNVNADVEPDEVLLVIE